MRRLFLPLVGAFTIAALIGTGLPGAAAASGPWGRRPSSRVCSAFTDYFQVTFAVAFLTGFAEAFEDLADDSSTTDDTRADDSTGGVAAGGGATDDDGSLGDSLGDDSGESLDIDQIRNVVYLVLSPRLEESTSVLARQAPRSLRRIFARQRDAFRDGVEILRDDLGLTETQLDEIREIDFNNQSPSDLASQLDIDESDLEAAAEKFGESAGDVLEVEDATQAQQSTLQRLAVDCGAVPETGLDCDELVNKELQQELLGATPEVENDDGTCTYTIEEDGGADEPELGVDVYRSTDTYTRLIGQYEDAEQVDGDQAIVGGFATFSSFKTCGRTLIAREASVTVVVALCKADDAEVTESELTDVLGSVNAIVQR